MDSLAARFGRALAGSGETSNWFFRRRLWALSRHLAQAIPGRGSVLELGCGDGRLALALMRLRPDLKVQGLEVAPRADALIPVSAFDGASIPAPDKSFDYVIMVDQLHHGADPAALLIEAARVARNGVVVKDHLCEGALARARLAVLCWPGRVARGPAAPLRFLSRDDWQGLFFRTRLQATETAEKLDLYLPPMSWLFGRRLHFITCLVPRPA